MTFIFILGICFSQPAFAASVKPPTIPCPANLTLPCITTPTQEAGAGSIREYILKTWGTNFLTGFLGISAAASVIFIIVGGLQMLLATGKDEDLKKAKNTIVWAIAGLVISMIAVALVQIISNLSFK